jgi:hypothetical protein
MRIFFCLLLLFLLTASCSNEDSVVNVPENIDSTINPDGTYFHMQVNGTAILFLNNPPFPSGFNYVNIIKSGDFFIIGGIFGSTLTIMGSHRFNLNFRNDGQIISAYQTSQNFDQIDGNLNFNNFLFFPSNYFQISITSIDEVGKRIKGSFQGNLYLNELDLDSESNTFIADFDWKYEDAVSTSDIINIYGIPQYCSAKFNGNLWSALRENTYSTFTCGDPFKIDIHFDSNAVPGSYNFTNNSSDNYIRFSKFNTTTRAFDYYNTTGVIAHSYREYHGGGRYSYIGTFTFEAVNPNDPSDVMQITDGTFRSFQQN